jgi:hypothetical protein
VLAFTRGRAPLSNLKFLAVSSSRHASTTSTYTNDDTLLMRHLLLELVEGASPLTLDATLRLTFKDGHAWIIQIRELSSITKSITFELISSEPHAAYSSAIHTISLKKLTGNGGTFVEWVSDYSSDATSEIGE